MTECDWIDQIQADLSALAAEVKTDLAASVAASQLLAGTIRGSSFSGTTLSAIANLPAKTELASEISKAATALNRQSTTLVQAVAAAEKHMTTLKRCCPPDTPPAA